MTPLLALGWLLTGPASAPAPAPQQTCEASLRRLSPEDVKRLSDATARGDLTAWQVQLAVTDALGAGASGGSVVAGLAEVADAVQDLSDQHGAADLWVRAASLPVEHCLTGSELQRDWLTDAADAMRHAERPELAVRIYRQLLRDFAYWKPAPDNPGVLRVQTALGDALRLAGHYREATALIDEALSRLPPGDEAGRHVEALQRRALLLESGPGSDAETIAAYRQVVAAQVARGASPWNVERSRLNLASFLIRTGHGAEALAIAEDVLAGRSERMGAESAKLERPLDVAIAAANQVGDWTRVAALARRAAAIQALARGPTHAIVGVWLARQHAALVESGHLAGAIEVENTLAAIGRRPEPNVWHARMQLGRLLAPHGRLETLVRLPPPFVVVDRWPWSTNWRHPDGTTANVELQGHPANDLFGRGSDESDEESLRRMDACTWQAVRVRQADSPAGPLTVATCTEPHGDEDRFVELTALRRGGLRIFLKIEGRTSTRATVEGAGRAARAGLKPEPK